MISPWVFFPEARTRRGGERAYYFKALHNFLATLSLYKDYAQGSEEAKNTLDGVALEKRGFA